MYTYPVRNAFILMKMRKSALTIQISLQAAKVLNSGGLMNIHGGIPMIYNAISFQAAPFSYTLEFFDRITLVRGDSASGKTYLYQLLEDLRLTEKYSAIKLYNYKTEDFHENLKKCREKFIVIDNGDLLLDDEDRRFINFEFSNQYMLFLRNCDGLNLSADSFMLLNEDNYTISLKKELVMV